MFATENERYKNKFIRQIVAKIGITQVFEIVLIRI
jgi:hypothetical protein